MDLISTSSKVPKLFFAYHPCVLRIIYEPLMTNSRTVKYFYTFILKGQDSKNFNKNFLTPRVTVIYLSNKLQNWRDGKMFIVAISVVISGSVYYLISIQNLDQHSLYYVT